MEGINYVKKFLDFFHNDKVPIVVEKIQICGVFHLMKFIEEDLSMEALTSISAQAAAALPALMRNIQETQISKAAQKNIKKSRSLCFQSQKPGKIQHKNLQARSDVLQHYPFIDNDGTMSEILKGEEHHECTFVKLLFGERIRLARNIYHQYRSGNIKLLSKDLRDALIALGLNMTAEDAQLVLNVLPPTLHKEAHPFLSPSVTLEVLMKEGRQTGFEQQCISGSAPGISLPWFQRVVQALAIEQGASDGPMITEHTDPCTFSSFPEHEDEGNTMTKQVRQSNPNQNLSSSELPRTDYRLGAKKETQGYHNTKQNSKKPPGVGYSGALATYGNPVKSSQVPQYLNDVKSKIKPGLDQLRTVQKQNRKVREMTARSEVANHRLGKLAQGERVERKKSRGAFARDIAENFLQSPVMEYVNSNHSIQSSIDSHQIPQKQHTSWLETYDQERSPFKEQELPTADDWWISEYEPQTFNINSFENTRAPRHPTQSHFMTGKVSECSSDDNAHKNPFENIGIDGEEFYNKGDLYQTTRYKNRRAQNSRDFEEENIELSNMDFSSKTGYQHDRNAHLAGNNSGIEENISPFNDSGLSVNESSNRKGIHTSCSVLKDFNDSSKIDNFRRYEGNSILNRNASHGWSSSSRLTDVDDFSLGSQRSEKHLSSQRQGSSLVFSASLSHSANTTLRDNTGSRTAPKEQEVPSQSGFSFSSLTI